MTKILLATLAPALMLSACATGGTDHAGVESIHQPVVARADYLLDLRTAGDGLSTGERQRLSGWLAGLRLGYGDRVSIDDPASEGRRAREAVAAAVAGYGLLIADQAPVTPAPVAPGTIRVVVSRMTARVPGCPDWSFDPSVDFAQRTGSNYGCANAVNLAAMVANPSDLVRGQGGTGNDAAVSYKAIDTYRKAVPTGAAGLPGGVSSVSVTPAAGGQ